MDLRSAIVKALGVALLAAPLWAGCSSEEETGPTEEPNVGPGVPAPEKLPGKGSGSSTAKANPAQSAPAK